MIENTILCVKWGDKYGREYVEKLKQQCEDNCSIPFNFYCLTDKKEKDYDILLPSAWDEYEGLHSRFRNKQAPSNMWAYRKLYMFQLDYYTSTGGWDESERDFKSIQGNNFLYLDLDVIIHQDLKYFFTLDMKQSWTAETKVTAVHGKPWIVRGWWNDMNLCRKNYAAMGSTPINSSVIRWNRGQLTEIYKHIAKNLDVLFFTYPSAIHLPSNCYFLHILPLIIILITFGTICGLKIVVGRMKVSLMCSQKETFIHIIRVIFFPQTWNKKN